jgi:hypothetical protein
MDIPKHQFQIKSLIFLESTCHAKLAPDTQGGASLSFDGRRDSSGSSGCPTAAS